MPEPPLRPPWPDSTWWRVLALAVVATWFGGLTFYAAVVVPTSADVLGSHTASGMITRRVTPWLNLIGGLVLLVLFLDTWFGRRRRAAWIAFALILVAQSALLVLHPLIDSHIDPDRASVRDYDSFYIHHRFYLWTSAAQWLGVWLWWWSRERNNN